MAITKTPSRLVTRTQLAALFDVKPATVAVTWEPEGLPIQERGRPGKATIYDTAHVHRWLVARALKAAQPAGSSGAAGLNLDTERARQANMQARRTELEVLKRQGELVEADDVMGLWREILAALRSTLLAMPSALAEELAAVLEPRAVEVVLRDRIAAALTEASAWRLKAAEGGPV